MAFLARLRRRAAAAPLEATLALSAVVVSLYVVIAPLTASRYPPMTDLPFHATFGATFLHYWDPSYHLQEQFRLAPFSHPYMSMYALIALLMVVFPMMWALRIALVVFLLMVPAGLAVLFHGAKKSPLLGLLGLGVCWGNLTHWGFINYVGALGLFAMVIGLSLMLIDRPTRGRQIALFAALVVLYFTHIFRYPFGIAVVVGTGVVMFPATAEEDPAPRAAPPPGGGALRLVVKFARPKELGGKLDLRPHTGIARPTEFGGALTGGFKDDRLQAARCSAPSTLAWGELAIVAARATPSSRGGGGQRRFSAWDAERHAHPLCCAGVFFAAFLTLPLFIGSWFYVFPREATAAVICLCGACPDLPRTPWLRVPLVSAMCAGRRPGDPPGVQRGSSTLGLRPEQREDFYAVTRHITRRPPSSSTPSPTTARPTASVSPFSHLPAYVQAEKGGFLSWSFAVWNHSPVMYRKGDEPGVVTLPSYPRFDPKREKPFYDWILYRQKDSPAQTFARDPNIKLVDHRGKWWLFSNT